MKKLPGFGSPIQKLESSIRNTVNRTSEMKGSNFVLEKDARDWYEEFNFKNEFSNYKSGMFKSEGEVDAFRHTYTSAMLAKTFGESVGRILVEAMNKAEYKESENGAEPGSNFMDIYNNINGLRLHSQLRQSLGREPTTDEIAEKVLEEIINRNTQVRQPNGKSGWRERLQKELDDRRAQRAIKDWSEKVKREAGTHRGEALAPRGHDRLIERNDRNGSNFDRLEPRPGYGEGRRMQA